MASGVVFLLTTVDSLQLSAKKQNRDEVEHGKSLTLSICASYTLDESLLYYVTESKDQWDMRQIIKWRWSEGSLC